MSKPSIYIFSGLCLVMSGLLWPETVLANPNSIDGINEFGYGDMGSYLIKVFVVLIIIIGLIFIFVRILAKKNKSWFGHRSITMLGGVQLGQNKSLRMMKIGKAIYIVGVGEEITLLDKIENEAEQEAIMASLEQEQETMGKVPFELVKRMLRKSDKQPAQGETERTFQEIFQQKMQRTHKAQDLLDQDDDWRSGR